MKAAGSKDTQFKTLNIVNVFTITRYPENPILAQQRRRIPFSYRMLGSTDSPIGGHWTQGIFCLYLLFYRYSHYVNMICFPSMPQLRKYRVMDVPGGKVSPRKLVIQSSFQYDVKSHIRTSGSLYKSLQSSLRASNVTTAQCFFRK